MQAVLCKHRLLQWCTQRYGAGALTGSPLVRVDTVTMCHAPWTGVRMLSRSMLLLTCPSAHMRQQGGFPICSKQPSSIPCSHSTFRLHADMCATAQRCMMPGPCSAARHTEAPCCLCPHDSPRACMRGRRARGRMVQRMGPLPSTAVPLVTLVLIHTKQMAGPSACYSLCRPQDAFERTGVEENARGAAGEVVGAVLDDDAHRVVRGVVRVRQVDVQLRNQGLVLNYHLVVVYDSRQSSISGTSSGLLDLWTAECVI